MQRKPPTPKLEVSTTQAEFLKNNANRMSPKEMANNLSVSRSKIYEWMKELDITVTRRQGNRKKEAEVLREGIFNPFEMSDWITGLKFAPNINKY